MGQKKPNLLAVIRVRGKINLDSNIKKTFQSLNLHNKNWCVILESDKSSLGMINKVKDYVTYGEISKDVLKELLKKRGVIVKEGKCFEYEKVKYQRYFRLSPPKKGYGRQGIKVSFGQGGALGYRKEKINDLLERMI